MVRATGPGMHPPTPIFPHIPDGVYFSPWIGDEYHLGFHGRRLLVLGESHYDTWDDGEGRGPIKHKLGPDFTKECVAKVIRREGAALWRYIEQILLNEGRKDGWAPSGASVWPHLAFYNFIQAAVEGKARQRPPVESFVQDRAAFREILELLRPERVLVCGKTLWRLMEATREEDRLHPCLQAYRLRGGDRVWCLAVRHPSSYCQWTKLHPIVMSFFDAPSDCARMLASAQ